MTGAQRRYLETVAGLIERLGYSPTIREVAAEVGRAPSSAEMALVSLERQGYLARGYASARTMRLTDAGRAALAVEGAA